MMEEIYREIPVVKNFLIKFPNREWKQVVFLLVEYAAINLSKSINMTNIKLYDIQKALNDIKNEEVFTIGNDDEGFIKFKKSFNNNSNLFTNPVFPEQSRPLSPTKSVASFVTMKSNMSKKSQQQQRVEEALQNSPKAKHGKFVVLDEDEENKEVVIKLNKCTYDEQIKNNNKALIFDKPKKPQKRESSNHQKQIFIEISPKKGALKNKSKVSVNQILDKLKEIPSSSRDVVIKYKDNDKSKYHHQKSNDKYYSRDLQPLKDQKRKYVHSMVKEKKASSSDEDETVYIIQKRKSKSKPKKKTKCKKILLKNYSDSSELSDYEDSKFSTEEVLIDTQQRKHKKHHDKKVKYIKVIEETPKDKYYPSREGKI